MSRFGDPLGLGQWRYRGLVIGPGTPIQVTGIGGWVGHWATRRGDVPIARGDGSFVGPHFVEQREIGLRLVVDRGMADLVELAFAPSQLVLHQLERQEPDSDEAPHLYADCRVVDMVRPRPPFAGVVIYDIYLVANNPRLQRVFGRSESVPVSTSTSSLGVDYKFNYPLNYPDTVTAGGVQISAGGTVPAFPTWVVQGPTSGTLSRFRLRNETTDEQITFKKDVTSGQEVMINMDAYATGRGRVVDLGGGSAFSGWETPRVVMRLAPGPNLVSLRVLAGSSTGVTGRIEWKDAWL